MQSILTSHAIRISSQIEEIEKDSIVMDVFN